MVGYLFTINQESNLTRHSIHGWILGLYRDLTHNIHTGCEPYRSFYPVGKAAIISAALWLQHETDHSCELILRSGMHRVLPLYPSMPSVWCSGTREILSQICSALTQKPGPMVNACDSLKEFTVYASFWLKMSYVQYSYCTHDCNTLIYWMWQQFVQTLWNQVHWMFKQWIRCKFLCFNSSVPEDMKPQH
jgi:hypothetical protein